MRSRASRAAGSTGSSGCSTRRRVARREALIEQARAVYRDPALRARPTRPALLANAQARGDRGARTSRRRASPTSTCRRARPSSASGARRAAPSARSCWRSSRSSAPGTATSSRSPSAPSGAAIHLDKLAELREDATRERLVGAERAAEAVRETWRALEEFNLAPQLAFEALFVRIAPRACAISPVASRRQV